MSKEEGDRKRNSDLLPEGAPHGRARSARLPPSQHTCLPPTAWTHCDAVAAHSALFTSDTMAIMHMSKHLVSVHIQIKGVKQKPQAKRPNWPAAARSGEQCRLDCWPCFSNNITLKNLNTPQLVVLIGLI